MNIEIENTTFYLLRNGRNTYTHIIEKYYLGVKRQLLLLCWRQPIFESQKEDYSRLIGEISGLNTLIGCPCLAI